MSELIYKQAIAIDTNVFEHLFFPQRNDSCHINKILRFLMEGEAKLLVDENRIPKEYHKILGQRLQTHSEHLDEVQLLRYWLNSELWKTIPVDELDQLMRAIKVVVRGNRQITDRTFVYVAFSQGENLITNDMGDLFQVGGKRRRPNMHTQLKRKTKRVCPASRESRILTSSEVFGIISSQ